MHAAQNTSAASAAAAAVDTDDERSNDAASALLHKPPEQHQHQQQSATLHIASVAEQQQQRTPSTQLLHRLIWSSGVACVLIAALIFAVAALLVKLTHNRVPVLEITLIRSTISLVVSAVLIKVKNIQPALGQRHNIKWLVPRGVFGAIAMSSFYGAILLLPLADGFTLFFCNPMLTSVSAWAIRGEPLGLLGGVGCLVSLVGMVVLIHPPMFFGGHADWGSRRVWGTAFGLVSAVCCAGAFLSIRYIGKSEPAIVVALYFHACTAVLSAVPLMFGFPQAWKPLAWFDLLLVLGVAAGSFLGQLFMTRALQVDNASLISSLNFSQVLYSYAFGLFFFSEHLSLFGVLGSVLVALGMVCVTLPPKGSASAAPAVPDDAAAAAAAGGGRPLRSSSSSSFSLERARRLDSFKRLLSRARGNEGSSSSGDLQLQDDGGEGLPLTSDVGPLSDADVSSQPADMVVSSTQGPPQLQQVWSGPQPAEAGSAAAVHSTGSQLRFQ